MNAATGMSTQNEIRLRKLTALLEVAKAMSYERNLDALLDLILREVTRVMDADRSSLFLVDHGAKQLRAKVAQGLQTREFRLNWNQGVAGHVAMTGQMVNIKDAYEDPRFDRMMDVNTGYRTKSVLCVPMVNRDKVVIGVVQVLNKKDGIFNAEDEELLSAFTGQAAAAVETALLYEEIQELFEGFIHASVYAIESRDATTSGHSARVASLTVALADHVSRVTSGPFAGVRFGPEEMREIRYASLLHDFGKIGVREQVLVKANKLYPHELEMIRMRFALAKKSLELECAQGKLKSQELATKLSELDGYLSFVERANMPAVLEEKASNILRQLSPYLTEQETANLSIPRGSLNDQERLEIESHVTHTYNFLKQIPWTKGLKRIPEIAGSHHEKMNGKGYPNRLSMSTIPIQARMMTIADIYDALTASDRPYKKALPRERALNILEAEASQGNIDAELFKIFTDEKVYE